MFRLFIFLIYIQIGLKSFELKHEMEKEIIRLVNKDIKPEKILRKNNLISLLLWPLYLLLCWITITILYNKETK